MVKNGCGQSGQLTLKLTVCISRTNQWNELVSCMLVKIEEN